MLFSTISIVFILHYNIRNKYDTVNDQFSSIIFVRFHLVIEIRVFIVLDFAIIPQLLILN